MDLIQKVEQTIHKEGLLDKGQIIAVAVSGGADSVALLHILHVLSPVWRWKLVVVHVNHQFRGQESDEETAEVVKLAGQLGLPCEVGVIDVPEYMKQHNLNAQSAARDKRYEFLRYAAALYGATHIALGHHADDQAETVLMRFIRGSGSGGLKGMPIRRLEKKVELIRPLLRIYKAEISAYCMQTGLPYSNDSSNAERKYFRNQVRLDVLPFLMQYNLQLPQSLNRLSDVMEAEDEYLESETKRLYQQHVAVQDTGNSFSRAAFVLMPTALQRRLIKLILNGLSEDAESLDFTKIEILRYAVLQDKPASTVLDISDQLHFVREYDTVGIIRKGTNPAQDYEYTIPHETVEVHIAQAAMILKVSARGNHKEPYSEAPLGKYHAGFDADVLVFPLTVRNRRNGDRMNIIGLNGSKKVKDIFIDDKVGKSKRNYTPIILNGDNTILWIPGIRKSIHAMVGESTRHIIHMEAIRLILP
ncbi:MAG TPA: tRNA lysidine(34) synthetase TilS [Bacilli bacterium]